MATKQPQKLKTSFHVDFNFISPPSFLSSQNKRQTKLQQKNSVCSITPKATEEFTPFRVSHTTVNRYCGKTSQEILFVLEGILTNNRRITLKLGSCSVLRYIWNFALIRFPLNPSKTGVQKFWHIMHMFTGRRVLLHYWGGKDRISSQLGLQNKAIRRSKQELGLVCVASCTRVKTELLDSLTEFNSVQTHL